MKFSEFNYKRPNMKEVEMQFNKLLDIFNNSNSFEAQDKAMYDINELRKDFESMHRISEIKYTTDTENKLYEEEKNYFDENNPLYEKLISEYYKALVNSKFRKELEKKWGTQLFSIANLNIKTISDEVIEDLKVENKLKSEYSKLLASARILFDGKELTLPQIRPYAMSKDRKTRKEANEAKCKFLTDNEEKFDRIYDELVKIRTTIAKKLGYENFIQLGYDRMLRSDYNFKDVAIFRKQIKEHIVPLVARLKDRQSKRLGLDKLKYYDEVLQFKSGNPKPRGDADKIITNAKKMYNELSNETSIFFNFMIDNELMDLLSRQGKYPGGYCDFIPNYKSPFIFANFNGTSGDIDVLTHEAGHAFQMYSSRNYEIPEYYAPTFEACEIHSMSMEFITWPWMELFYEEETEKSKFNHMSSSLSFLPYGVTVDEFQHFVYENPTATPVERKKVWREIEKKYLPDRDYEDNDFLNRGGFWFQQGHIFEVPFYYIDYVLAQICALQFWKKFNEDKEKAWYDYHTLCKAGGSNSFVKLANLANLTSPFEDGCIASVIEPIENWLNSINDSKL